MYWRKFGGRESNQLSAVAFMVVDVEYPMRGDARCRCCDAVSGEVDVICTPTHTDRVALGEMYTPIEEVQGRTLPV